jgi:hypothetical protein
LSTSRICRSRLGTSSSIYWPWRVWWACSSRCTTHQLLESMSRWRSNWTQRRFRTFPGLD